ncbi:MAG: hypothetical protein ABIG42_06885, partial [bacterium]
PFLFLRQITTFTLEYEWHHTSKNREANLAKPENMFLSETTADESNSTSMNASTGKDDSWFPLTVGNRWVYEHKKTGGMMNPDEEVVTMKVMEIVERIDVRQTILYKMKITENEEENFSYYFVDEEGIKVTYDERRPRRQAMLVLIISPEVDDTWFETDPSSPSSKVVRRENFSFSGKELECIMVETSYSNSTDRTYQTWYARDVGIAMQVIGSSARGKDEWMLKECSVK